MQPGDEKKDVDDDGVGDELVVYVKIRISQHHQRHDEVYLLKASLYSICDPEEEGPCESAYVDSSDEETISVTASSLQDKSLQDLAIHFDGGMLRKFAEERLALQPSANTTSAFVLRHLEIRGNVSRNTLYVEYPEGISFCCSLFSDALSSLDLKTRMTGESLTLALLLSLTGVLCVRDNWSVQHDGLCLEACRCLWGLGRQKQVYGM